MAKTMPELYQIRYALQVGWSLEDAASLLLGICPGSLGLSPKQTRAIEILSSQLFIALKKNDIHHARFFQFGAGIQLSPEDVLEWAQKQKGLKIDPYIEGARKWAIGDSLGEKKAGQFDKLFYTTAAKILWDMHPQMTKAQTPRELILLVKEMNALHRLDINMKSEDAISEYLREVAVNRPAGRVKNADRFKGGTDVVKFIKLFESK